MSRTTAKLPREKRRGFRVTVTHSDGTNYGLTIAETNGHPDHTNVVATVRPADLLRLNDTVQAVLRASKKPATTIGPGRQKPIEIDEAPGVRLALTALAVEPVRRRDRSRAIVEGIASMSDEEAYYWYAKVTHPDAGGRCLRSLRLMLSDDER
ncbi:MAG: hypothetical protein WBF71_12005 [Microthrixaceae bacterium]